jgi:serine/threonine protein kinase
MLARDHLVGRSDRRPGGTAAVKTCEHCGFEPVQGDTCPLCGKHVVGLEEVGTQTVLDLQAPSRPTTGRDVPGQEYPPGYLYDGRYRIESFIGRGGMGRVYKVMETATGRAMALKILLRSVMEDEDAVERFRREIMLLSEIKHPAVPAVFGWGYHNGEYFFVSDYIDGRDLRSLSKARGPWPIPEAVAIVARVADALSAAHEKGIVHRDVKPHNIMVAQDNAVFLLDFGVARAYGHEMQTITATGMLVGTPEYMSPEQVDSHQVDARSDIYSLGVVLFELLVGKPPFAGDTPIAVAMKHKQDPPPSPRVLRQEIPFWLERVVLRCLAKDPRDRYPTAARVASELSRPHSEQPARRRRLPSGDLLVEDEGQASDWALVLASPHEKHGWREGMALRFENGFYCLAEVCRPSAPNSLYEYRFLSWDSGAILRKVVDYEADCVEQLARRPTPLSAQLRSWFRGRKG